jgi:ATP-binding cassette subfamily C protein CydCD
MQALLVLVPLALGDVLVPLADAGTLSVRTQRARTRLAELLATDPAVNDPESPTTPGAGHHLNARDLAVGWDRVAADGINLDVTEGRRIAVVGPSGCGKSTLAATLVRFLDPHAGSAALDGHDLRGLLLDDVRERVGFLDDDPHVFSTSLVENVRLARPEATDDDVAHALRQAYLGAWLEGLPAGLHTMLGDGHADVSGGERARIGIARTLLAGQRVVVLDEPTAHIDSATADAIADEVLSGDRGVVWITHGTAGLDRVDEVLLLQPAGAVLRPPARRG